MLVFGSPIALGAIAMLAMGALAAMALGSPTALGTAAMLAMGPSAALALGSPIALEAIAMLALGALAAVGDPFVLAARFSVLLGAVLSLLDLVPTLLDVACSVPTGLLSEVAGVIFELMGDVVMTVEPLPLQFAAALVWPAGSLVSVAPAQPMHREVYKQLSATRSS